MIIHCLWQLHLVVWCPWCCLLTFWNKITYQIFISVFSPSISSISLCINPVPISKLSAYNGPMLWIFSWMHALRQASPTIWPFLSRATKAAPFGRTIHFFKNSLLSLTLGQMKFLLSYSMRSSNETLLACNKHQFGSSCLFQTFKYMYIYLTNLSTWWFQSIKVYVNMYGLYD